MSHEKPASILKQPTAVWAVAFASVIAFMGIGLVDPILPAIAASLKATPTETEMLFTSYLLITGAAMFFTSWISSRIGAKKTLLIGLALIVVFALAAGLSPNVEAIIGFRAGWGLGNALFISTALATIVGAASGGTSSAIILYEAALGLGIAIGPLLGGLLGSWSWRGPFFGTSALMAIGFIAIVLLLKKNPEKASPTSLGAPFKALAKPALGFLAAAALFYNIGFFVLLAYTPFALVPLGVDSAISLGFIFFGWGVALAITSVWGAPLLTNRMPRTRVLWIVMPLLAIDLGAAGTLHRVGRRTHRLRHRRRTAARHPEHRAHRVRDGGDGPSPHRGVERVLGRAVPRRCDRAARGDPARGHDLAGHPVLRRRSVGAHRRRAHRHRPQAPPPGRRRRGVHLEEAEALTLADAS